jgi:hypothetical protein
VGKTTLVNAILRILSARPGPFLRDGPRSVNLPGARNRAVDAGQCKCFRLGLF